MTEETNSIRPTRRQVLGWTVAGGAVSALSLLSGPSAAAADAPPRVIKERDRLRLADGWRFSTGDPAGAQVSSFSDSGWAAVAVPHTWNALDSIDDERGYYRGPGWYRTSLRMDQRYNKGERLFLYFEGANQVADVYVEGVRVGGHVGGYQAFSVEVTEQLRGVRPGRDAVIAVRVDNSYNADVPPLTADFTFYGGIYRNVWLVVTPAVHLDLLDHASPGVYVDTPDASAASATVRVRSRVVNDSDDAATVDVQSFVLAADGSTVTSTLSSVRVGSRASTVVTQTVTVPKPRLWSPESPYLYSVRTVVGTGPQADRVDVPLGVRWFKADRNGFFLNGKAYPLRGANRHQDIVGQGNALSDEEHRRDLSLIKAMGANVVRLAHYPQSPAVLEAADELGLILWEEAPLVNTVTMSAAYTANSLGMQREMIRQHYNHPSIVFWGYMNEIFLNVPNPEPAGYTDHVVGLAQQLEDLTRSEDASRLTVMAVNRNDRYNPSGICEVPMIVAWNLYYNWYYGNLEGFAQHLDTERSTYPNRLLWVSEYGADTDSRLHRVDVQQLPVNQQSGRVSYQDQSTEYGQLFHETYTTVINDRPWLVGTTLWAQFEFGSESRAGSIPHVNQKGIMHPDRTPKDTYFLYQALWLSSPVLKIASREWNHRTGTSAAGQQTVTQPVKVYSNLASVELLVGGRSLGSKAPGAGRGAVWDVPFVDGANAVLARGRTATGALVEDTVDITFTRQAAVLADPGSPFRRLAVSAGAIVQYIDPDTLVWCEDRTYASGAWGAVGGTTGLNGSWVNRSTEDPLYQTYRQGMSAYRFDVPDGSYEVQLRFASPGGTVGSRVFDVALNGATLASGLDLVAVAGANTAFDLTGLVDASGGGGLTVGFTPRSGSPVISGIDVRRT